MHICGWQFLHLCDVCLCIWESLYICGTVVFPFVGFLCAVIRAGHKTHLPFYVNIYIYFFAGRIKRWLWSTAVLLMAAGLVYNLVLLSIRYFSYPILITVRLQTEPNLAFPAVTLCNTSPVRNSKWSEYQKQMGQTEEPVPKVKRSAKQTEQTQESVTKVKRSAKQTEQTQEPVTKVKRSAKQTEQTQEPVTKVKRSAKQTEQTQEPVTKVKRSAKQTEQTQEPVTKVKRSAKQTEQTQEPVTKVKRSAKQMKQTHESSSKVMMSANQAQREEQVLENRRTVKKRLTDDVTYHSDSILIRKKRTLGETFVLYTCT